MLKLATKMDETGLLFFENASSQNFGFIFELDTSGSSDTSINALVTEVLSALPPGSVLQIATHSSADISKPFKAWADARVFANHASSGLILEEIERETKETLLATRLFRSMLPEERFHPRRTRRFMSVLVRRNKQLWRTPTELQAFKQGVLTYKEVISELISKHGVKRTALKAKDFTELLDALWEADLGFSPQAEEAKQCYAQGYALPKSSRRLLLNAKGHLRPVIDREDEPKVVCLTTKQVNETTGLIKVFDNVAANDNIACPYWAYLNIVVPDALTGVNEHDSRAYSKFEAYAGVNLYCNREEDTVRQAERASLLYEQAGAQLIRNIKNADKLFLGTLPLQHVLTPSVETVFYEQIAPVALSSLLKLVPLKKSGLDESSGEGGLLLAQRDGTLEQLDIFDANTSNGFVVAGRSGSGKSMLVSEIATTTLAQGGIVRLIDEGYSHRRYCETMAGKYIELSEETPINLNPFQEIDCEETLQHMLKGITLAVMSLLPAAYQDVQWRDHYFKPLEAAIEASWLKHKNKTELSDVYAWLLEHKEENIVIPQLLTHLSPYVDGKYKDWFNGPNRLDFSNKLVVFEVSNLDKSFKLKEFVVQLLVYHATHDMYWRKREAKKLLVIEEGWSVLRSLSSSELMVYCRNQMGLYRGVLGITLQSVSDLKDTPAEALLKNRPFQYLILDKAAFVGEEATTKLFDAYSGLIQHEQVKSLSHGKGYRELYILTGKGEGVYRHIANRFSYYLYTTDVAAIQKINALKNKGYTLIAACKKLAMSDYSSSFVED